MPVFQNCSECQCDQSHMLWAGGGKSLEAYPTHGKASPASSRQLSLTRPQGRMACGRQLQVCVLGNEPGPRERAWSAGMSLVRGEQGALFTSKCQSYSSQSTALPCKAFD